MQLRPLTIGLLAIVFLFAACRPTIDEEAVDFRLPVTVREVGTGTVENRVVASGTLRAPEAISLRSETSGILRVARLESGRRIAEGDRVRAGQTIAEITGDEVRLAARTEATEQRYRSAKTDYESNKRLYDQGLISELVLRGSADALADAKMELDRSRLTETRSNLVTPISGMVLKLARDEQGMPLAEGQLVVQGQVIAQVGPTRRMIADVDLVGPDIARVKRGMEARVRHHAWEERRFDGRVIRLAPSIDPQTRTLRAEVEIDNGEGLLRPGMFVEVTLVSDRREGVPVVPRRAVTERGGRKVVFLLNGQKVKQTPVTLGYGDDETVEIREGVQTGDRVVVSGLETLSDEMNVRVTGS